VLWDPDAILPTREESFLLDDTAPQQSNTV
jgi:hypothetical protein